MHVNINKKKLFIKCSANITSGECFATNLLVEEIGPVHAVYFSKLHLTLVFTCSGTSLTVKVKIVNFQAFK